MDLSEDFYPNINKIEILTEDGFKPFAGVQVNRGKIVQIETQNSSIRVTQDHELYSISREKYVASIELYVGELVFGIDGPDPVTKIEFTDQLELVADILNVEDTHSYFANNILNSNCSLIYLDEFAFVPNAEEFFRSTYPVISSGKETKLIVSSTANGLNLFYKMWKDANEGRSDLKPFRVDWFQVPGRDEAWKIRQLAILGQHGFDQEYGNEFLGSANTLIAGHKLKELTYEVPIKSDNEIKILEEPKVDILENGVKSPHRYLTVVDCCRGVGEDYHTVTVFDITSFPYKTVFTFRSNTVKPMALSSIIVPIAKKYHDSYLLIERNDIGLAVAESCFFDHEYENIFSTKTGGKRGQQLTYGSSKTAVLGVQMTKSVKRVGHSNLKSLIEGNKLIQFTEEQVMELYNFVSKGDSFEADSGSHDDLVMNMVLFSWAVVQPFYQQLMTQRIQDEFPINPVEEYNNLGFFVMNDGIDRDDEPVSKNWSIETVY